MDALAARIKELRLEQGHTLRGFARAVAVSPAYVVDLEAGRRQPGPEVLGRIAAALGVFARDLQALDPRIPPAEMEAFRLALAASPDELEHHLAGLEEWQVERLSKAADLLDGAAGNELGRRH